MWNISFNDIFHIFLVKKHIVCEHNYLIYIKKGVVFMYNLFKKLVCVRKQ